MTEALSILKLLQTPCLGSKRILSLIKAFGSAKKALEAPPSEWIKVPGIGKNCLVYRNAWEKERDWEKEFQEATKLKVTLIAYGDPLYPKELLAIEDPPVLLYAMGPGIPLQKPTIAIVGTREATLYGKTMAEQFASELTQLGFCVISGLARGIDTAAHVGALNYGSTIGIIGSGLMSLYPKENFELAKQMSLKGALISEFPLNTPPHRKNFPRRNRLVAGLSTCGTLLIEAKKEKSGAMITMEITQQQKKPLFVIPGRLDLPSFTGNHHLLKTNKAHLVETASDIANFFNIPLNKNFDNSSLQLADLSEKERQFLNQLPKEEVSCDVIAAQLKLPISEVLALLTPLILKKRMKEYPGKIYKKV